MKEILKRDLNKTYLILSSEEKQYGETYEIEMIVKNAPLSILPMHVLRVNGEIKLYYDISAKQTLKDCAGRAKLSQDVIRTLFETIEQLMKDMKDYLLDMESVVLDMQHIYAKEGKFYFCYCPWEKQEVFTSFRKLLEELLRDLDYRDTEGVELAYHLYQSACRGDLHIAKILKEHCREENSETEAAKKEQSFHAEEEQQMLFEENAAAVREEDVVSPGKKKGLVRRIVQFFMKKEKPKEETEAEVVRAEKSYDPSIFLYEPEISYTQVLDPSKDDTILLDDMPVGRWKLRPLLPGYEEFCITGDNFLVGKKKDEVDGHIGRDTISRIHSRLFVRQDRLFIADANSTNGTYVNEIAIAPGKEVEIFAGDRILFADVGYECYNSL